MKETLLETGLRLIPRLAQALLPRIYKRLEKRMPFEILMVDWDLSDCGYIQWNPAMGNVFTLYLKAKIGKHPVEWDNLEVFCLDRKPFRKSWKDKLWPFCWTSLHLIVSEKDPIAKRDFFDFGALFPLQGRFLPGEQLEGVLYLFKYGPYTRGPYLICFRDRYHRLVHPFLFRVPKDFAEQAGFHP